MVMSKTSPRSCKEGLFCMPNARDCLTPCVLAGVTGDCRCRLLWVEHWFFLNLLKRKIDLSKAKIKYFIFFFFWCVCKNSSWLHLFFCLFLLFFLPLEAVPLTLSFLSPLCLLQWTGSCLFPGPWLCLTPMAADAVQGGRVPGSPGGLEAACVVVAPPFSLLSDGGVALCSLNSPLAWLVCFALAECCCILKRHIHGKQKRQWLVRRYQQIATVAELATKFTYRKIRATERGRREVHPAQLILEAGECCKTGAHVKGCFPLFLQLCLGQECLCFY